MPKIALKPHHMKVSRVQASESDDEGESDFNPQEDDGETDDMESDDNVTTQHERDMKPQGESDSDDSEVEDEEEEEEETEDDKGRKSYEGMTMLELLKLQEDLGTKAFTEKVLKKGRGSVSKDGNPRLKTKDKTTPKTIKQNTNKSVLKRADKNRPLEVPMLRQAAPRLATLDPGHTSKRVITRDPRFDDLSGDLNLRSWQENYGFLKEMRKKEKELLKKELKEEQDPEKKKRMKSIIQRIENQERERARREKEREVKQQERQEQREALRQGRKPRFMSNKDRRLMVKTAQFEELKKGNKLEKYLERKEKRLKAKEMKKKY